MIEKPYHIPARLGLLSAAAADPFLTEDLLKGVRGHGGVDLAKVVEPLPEDDARWEVEPLRDLVDDAMFQFKGSRTDADGWLAPRLHATLRLTRREAADKRLWNHFALAVAPDYVAWRHPPTASQGKVPRINTARFKGAPDRQCFSRLWWAAEMFRNGADYRPVVTACSNQDLIHNALRLDLVDHRPTALALVRVLERGVASTGREINGLMTAINTAGATLVYDALAEDVPRDPGALRRWIAEAETAPPVPRHDLPTGPDEEPVPEESLLVLTDYLAKLFETAPVRGRTVEA
ncbi:DUF6339 family protein [Streptomyces griseoviridis]|uniref:Uncharacterized protein n=2 Tax=Streptomyces TaxID=1883 RepID=A0A918G326_STRGD|nr:MULTISPECIES: DUF6339 family protein [Streptomyces]GGS16804.1 hypothetical protein GCM10010238_00790 [Streptomyces niveoruber]GGU35231.1 hypothetical protein GCM10010259_27170 [Streptomyces daghestanicus]GHI33984.1 hypothetical protein Sdagh_57140 [Streptomyces daghestanicus]